MGAHLDLGVVDRKVHRAATETKLALLRIAVAPVLLDRVTDGLFGQAVFQLERRHRQAVDEQAEVE